MTPALSRVIIAAIAAQLASTAQAQQPGVTVPAPALHSIAVDFDAGLNNLYCFFGRADRALSQVVVDSIKTVTSPSACTGMGLGFVARIADSEFLMHALRGLIDGNPQFAIVSAFYKTEDIEVDGGRLHAARAFSVIRGPATVTLGRSSGGR